MIKPHTKATSGSKQSRACALALASAPVALSLLLFVLLAEDVIERESFRFDAPLLLWLHARQLPLLDAIMLGFSRIGGALLLLLAAIFALVLWQLKRARQAAFFFISVAGSAVLNLGAKTIFGRARPDLWLSIAPERDFGFPSGHAMLSSAFTLALLVIVWRSGASRRLKRGATIAGAIFVVVVGLSRLYLGVHFPSDVLAGWALSAAWIGILQHGLRARVRPNPQDANLAIKNLLSWRSRTT